MQWTGCHGEERHGGDRGCGGCNGQGVMVTRHEGDRGIDGVHIGKGIVADDVPRPLNQLLLTVCQCMSVGQFKVPLKTSFYRLFGH